MLVSSQDHFTHIDHLPDGETIRVEMRNGVRVVWLKTPPYSGNGFGRAWNAIVHGWRVYAVGRTLLESPDVVVGPSVPLFSSMGGLLLSFSLKTAFVFEVRDIWPQALVDIGGISKYGPTYFIMRLLERALYGGADKIITTLPLSVPHILSSSRISEKNIEWVPNGVKLSSWPRIPLRGGKPDGQICLTYVGGFSLGHNVEDLIRGYAIAKKTCSGLSLVLAGDGVRKSACEELVRSLNVGDVSFLGVVPKKNVPEILANADVVLATLKNAAVYRFGINLNKLYDYFAAGRPIIFSGSVPNDMVREAGAGISVPPDSPNDIAAAIVRMSKMSGAERISFGNNARKYAEEHLDTELLAKKIEKTLYDAVGARRNHAS